VLKLIQFFLCRCACKSFDSDFVLFFPAAITTTLVQFTQFAATFFAFVHFPHTELLAEAKSIARNAFRMVVW
jgi:hypothetical protein